MEEQEIQKERTRAKERQKKERLQRIKAQGNVDVIKQEKEEN